MLAHLTGDQLTALALSLHLPSFPGAPSALLDALPAEHRTPVVTSLLASMEAAGHLVRSGDDVVVDPDLALLVLPLLEGDTWLVERREADQEVTTLVGVLADVVVVHTAHDGVHTLAAADSLLDVLVELVDASEGAAPATRSVRHPRSGLLDRVAMRETAEGWRATTTLQRLSGRGGVEKASVLDGGPGRLWWVTLDSDADDALDDDPMLEAAPVGPEALAERLGSWVLASPAPR